MKTTVITLSLLLSAAVCFPPTAYADMPAAAAPTSPVARAAELFRQANMLYEEDKLVEAEALYRDAWALQQSWDIACNLGVVELDLGKSREAAEHLAFALREYPAGEKVSRRTLLEERFASAKALVASLRIRTNASGAQVLVDGKVIGTSPLPSEVFVNPGTVTVKVSAVGYEDSEKHIDAMKGGSHEVSINLTPRPKSLLPAYVLGGVAIAAAATGAGLLIASAGKRGEAEVQRDGIISAFGAKECNGTSPSQAARAACDMLVDNLRQRDALGNAGLVTLVGAGAAGGAAVVYWLVARRTTTQTGIAVWPAVSQNSGGMLVRGTF